MDHTADQVNSVLAERGLASLRGEGGSLKELLSILRRRKWLIAGTIALITGLTTLYVFTATPLYTATLKLVFDPTEQNFINFDAAISGQPQDEAALLSEIEVVKSRHLALRVINKLGLDKDPELNAHLVPPGPVWWLAELFSAPEPSDGFAAPPPIPPANDAGASAAPRAASLTADEQRTIEQERIIDKFLYRLDATRTGRSRAVAVDFTSKDPGKAAAVANTIGDLFLVERLEGKFDNARRASKWLAEHVQPLRFQVEEAEAKVEDYRRDHNLLRGERVTLITEQISSLNQQLSEGRRARTEAETNFGQVRRLFADPRKLSTAVQVLDSDLVQRLREKQADLTGREAASSQELGPKHPQILQLREEKERFAAEVQGEVDKIITSLENKVELARHQEASIAADLEELKAQMGEANEASVGLHNLEREANANRLMLDKFMSAFMETSAQQDVEFHLPDARIISPAAVPDRPSFPRKALMIAGGFAVSVMIALVLALSREQLDRGFRSAEQVEGETGLPVIAHVPLVEAGRGAVPAEYILTRPDSAFGTAILSIFTRLLLTTPAHPPQVILVTSSEPGEGKTSVSFALARLQAKAGRKVILLDADFRKPGIAKLIGVPGSPGLIELINGKAGLEEVIHTDERSGADVIVSGSHGQDALTAFVLGQMSEVVERLRSSYDFVIIDSAPVLVNSDAHALSVAADETLLVVRWGVTRREVVCFAVKQLRGLGTRLGGVVLSMFDAEKSARYNYGDSGHYFGKARQYYSG